MGQRPQVPGTGLRDASMWSTVDERNPEMTENPAYRISRIIFLSGDRNREKGIRESVGRE